MILAPAAGLAAHFKRFEFGLHFLHARLHFAHLLHHAHQIFHISNLLDFLVVKTQSIATFLRSFVQMQPELPIAL